jgi:hypothetical protein
MAKILSPIQVQTSEGAMEVQPVRIVGQCAIHAPIEGQDGFTVTHIASGYKVIVFDWTIKLTQVVRFAKLVESVDLDTYYDNGMTNTEIRSVMKSIYKQWRRNEGMDGVAE